MEKGPEVTEQDKVSPYGFVQVAWRRALIYWFVSPLVL